MLTNGFKVTNLEKGFTMFCIDKGSDLDRLEKMIGKYEKEKQRALMGLIVSGLFYKTNTESHYVESVVFSRTEDGNQLVLVSANPINMNEVASEMMVLKGKTACPFSIDIHEIIERAFYEVKMAEEDTNMAKRQLTSGYYYKCSMSDLSKLPFKLDAVLLADTKGHTYVCTTDLVEDYLGAPIVFEHPPIMKVVGHVSEYQ